jgi:serine/threonine protein kinase
MGILSYMPPEQIEDAIRADHRTDIYSLGATLYHMLAGKRPFSGKSNMDFFVKILHEEPAPLTDVRADVPPVVMNLVATCMRKKPEERYQTAGRLVTEIDFLFGDDEGPP